MQDSISQQRAMYDLQREHDELMRQQSDGGLTPDQQFRLDEINAMRQSGIDQVGARGEQDRQTLQERGRQERITIAARGSTQAGTTPSVKTAPQDQGVPVNDPNTNRPIGHVSEQDFDWIHRTIKDWARGLPEGHEAIQAGDAIIEKLRGGRTLTDAEQRRLVDRYWRSVPEVLQVLDPHEHRRRQVSEVLTEPPWRSGSIQGRAYQEAVQGQEAQAAQPAQPAQAAQPPQGQPRNFGRQSRNFMMLPRQLKDTLVKRMAEHPSAHTQSKEEIIETLRQLDAEMIEQILEGYGL